MKDYTVTFKSALAAVTSHHVSVSAWITLHEKLKDILTLIACKVTD